MKKPTDKAYATYDRYMKGDKIDDIAFELDISNSQAYKNIERVREYEHYNNYPKMTELIKTKFGVTHLSGRKLNTEYVQISVLFDALFTIYMLKIVKIRMLDALEDRDMIHNIHEETDGFDVVINLQAWENKTLTRYVAKFQKKLETLTISFFSGAYKSERPIKVFHDVEFKDRILKVNFSEDLKVIAESYFPFFFVTYYRGS